MYRMVSIVYVGLQSMRKDGLIRLDSDNFREANWILNK